MFKLLTIYVLLSFLKANIEARSRSHNNRVFTRTLRLHRPFPCRGLGPSAQRPTSVHRLRPADIKVVAALGDSLTAGNGALARNISELLLEYRGVAFPIGGDIGRFTIPNFLRHYNPTLTGYSKGVGVGKVGAEPSLNLAVPGAKSDGLMRQVSTRLEPR